jgi:Glycosyl hydrolase family 12
LWDIDVDAFGSNAGSGTMSIDYTGTGTISWTIDYTGLNSSPINGYPNAQFGSGDGAPTQTPGNQGLVFPQLLSSMTSLVIDTKYALACTTCPGNMDVMYDQWLTPTASFGGGQSGSQEVSIFLYYDFAESEANGTPAASVTEPVTINGTINPSFVWNIFAPGGASAGHQMIVVPAVNQQGTMAGELSFDQLPLLNKAASLAGETGWYFSGVTLGTEFGDGATANFTFTLEKLSVTQCP